MKTFTLIVAFALWFILGLPKVAVANAASWAFVGLGTVFGWWWLVLPPICEWLIIRKATGMSLFRALIATILANLASSLVGLVLSVFLGALLDEFLRPLFGIDPLWDEVSWIAYVFLVAGFVLITTLINSLVEIPVVRGLLPVHLQPQHSENWRASEKRLQLGVI